MYKIAIVGDKDSVLAFKILGVDVYISLDAQEARKIIDRISKEGYGIIFVTEQVAKGYSWDNKKDIIVNLYLPLY